MAGWHPPFYPHSCGFCQNMMGKPQIHWLISIFYIKHCIFWAYAPFSVPNTIVLAISQPLDPYYIPILIISQYTPARQLIIAIHIHLYLYQIPMKYLHDRYSLIKPLPSGNLT
jgi:hypothetical protein